MKMSTTKIGHNKLSHKITTLHSWMQWRKLKMRQNSLKTRHFNFVYDFGAIKRYTCVFFIFFSLHICSNRLVLLFILISNISIPILFFSFCFYFTISFPSFRKYWEYFAFFSRSLHLNFVNKPKRACGSSFLMPNINYMEIYNKHHKAFRWNEHERIGNEEKNT